MTEKREADVSVVALIAAMASNTGMHGLPNVGRSQHIARKIFWVIIFLVGAGKCSRLKGLVVLRKNNEIADECNNGEASSVLPLS